MSDAMNNPYANDPNTNNPNQNGSNGQQPQGQPEYGAYAPNQQSQSQQQGGNPNNSGNPHQSEPQTPLYFGDPNANQNPNQNGFFYASYTTGQPYGQQYGQQNSQPRTGNWQPISPFKLAEEWLPKKAKNAIRGTYAILGIAAIILGLALLIWPGATLKVAAIALGAYFVVSGVVRIVTAIVELGLPGGWRVLDILIGLMLAVGGVVTLKNAALSGATLAMLITMVVGLGWMLEGVMALVESWRMPSSAWAVIYALLSIIAGFIVLFSPISSTTWLILFGGCALVVIGIVAIVRAFTFGKPNRK
ncbi:HdeD family acid-resistance protein [Bifidobacterium hominis]|uniref:HdeD family acid-resistance protein n=1 Tax=Bifidobacterium hominis TaxID=3133177 RepID=UPI003D07F9F5